MNLAESTVGEIVAENFRTAQVFTKYGIDFCCGGNISLSEASKKQNVDLNLLEDELKAIKKLEKDIDYINFDTKKLIEHIVEVYHKYIREVAPSINLQLNKLCQVHGNNHPELYDIEILFKEVADTLLVHMQKEEQILFPLIEELEKRKQTNQLSNGLMPVEMPIKVMEQEHQEEGARFLQISNLSNRYQVPADGCQTYQATYAMLAEFEEKLHTHIHLENNILFPLAKNISIKL